MRQNNGQKSPNTLLPFHAPSQQDDSFSLPSAFEGPDGLYRGYEPFDTTRFIATTELANLRPIPIRASVLFVGPGGAPRCLSGHVTCAVSEQARAGSAPGTAPSSPSASKRSTLKTGFFKKSTKKDTNGATTPSLPPASPLTEGTFGFPDADVPVPASPARRHVVVNVRRRIAWYEQDTERVSDVLPSISVRYRRATLRHA